MHTTEEAKRTWCPWARVETGQLEAVSSALAAINRSFALLKRAFGGGNPDWKWDNDIACNCIADQCSQWVWAPPDWNSEGTEPETRGFCGRNTAMAMKAFGK